MRLIETLLRSRTGLAALALAMTLAGADAATRSGTLDVSLTILSQCTIRTSPFLQPADVERLVLAGQTTGTVRVQCSQGTPFALGWRRDPLRPIRSVVRFAPFGTAPFNPRFEELIAPDSPLSLTDSPSRLVMPIMPAEAGPAETAPATPPMIVITF